ncbi:MAG: 50S ribosomal protein L30e [Sulfolobales archaeon]|nr:50S ribosomal protein L30e [Sulfolobales archaeon]MDW8083220.1 50S ribosomal protein L30e [Sulfolobales archaeon]
MSEVTRPELEREMKNVIRTGKYVLGSKESLKAVLLGRAKAVVVASKILPEIEIDILHYAKLGNIPVVRYPGTSYELGLVCGRQFPVSVIAILDFGESRFEEVLSSV